MSLLHSVLKLVQKNYRDADVYKRIDIANNFYNLLQKKITVKDLSDFFKVNIKIYDEGKIKESDTSYDLTINIIKCLDKSYEPLVKMVGKKVMNYY